MVKFLDNKYTKIYYQLMNKGQLRENLEIGEKHTEEYKENMRNRFSKKWLVIDPQGNKIEVMNLNQYCRDNSLNSAHMNSVANGLRPHHKKYRVERD